jgi:hypothetical protein
VLTVSNRLAHTEEEAHPSERSDYDRHAWRVLANVHEKVGTTTCAAIKDHGPRYGITDNKRAPISSANAVRLLVSKPLSLELALRISPSRMWLPAACISPIGLLTSRCASDRIDVAEGVAIARGLT